MHNNEPLPGGKRSTEDVLKERGHKYGSFDNHAKLTQGLKDIFYAHMQHYNSNAKLTDYEREGLDMIFHKLGRIGNGDPHYPDSFVDIAGYAKLVADLQEQDAAFNKMQSKVPTQSKVTAAAWIGSTVPTGSKK